MCNLSALHPSFAPLTDATKLTEIAADPGSTWLHDPAPGRPCTIIGEVAQAHDGSLGMAHAHIDAIAAAGGDAVKFQTHIAVAESTAAEPWRKRFSPQDETRLDYWRRMEFTEDQWLGLRRHADEKSLLFLSSPFSLEATELLYRVGVAGWKVASGEINNFPMLDRMTETGLPVILSTGMSGLAEIDASVARIQASDAPLAVLQCASIYPSPAAAIASMWACAMPRLPSWAWATSPIIVHGRPGAGSCSQVKAWSAAISDNLVASVKTAITRVKSRQTTHLPLHCQK